MIYKRRYVQFNDLVFDGYDMIRDGSDGNVSFKAFSSEYTYRRGDYVAFKKDHMIPKAQTVSMTLIFHMKKLPCEYRPYYKGYAIEELTKPGKLWAVQNNELVWAYAYLSGYSESSNAKRDTIEIDVDFVLYEGVFHKANKATTFLKSYDICTYLDCKGFKEMPSICKDCCDCVKEHEDECCCDCDLEKSDALCYFKDLQLFYARCQGAYQIVTNCIKGQEFFGNKYLGQKICNKDLCCNVLAGQIYSDTDIPTDLVTIILSGGAKNPHISINGNMNIIEGEFEGDLTILPSGDIIHTTECCEEYVSPTAWVIPEGNVYGWEMHQGNNRVEIDSCETVCAYIQIDSLTI